MQAKAKGRQPVEVCNSPGFGTVYTVQMHSPADPLSEVCKGATVPDRAKSTPTMGVSHKDLSVGFDIAAKIRRAIQGRCGQ